MPQRVASGRWHPITIRQRGMMMGEVRTFARFRDGGGGIGESGEVLRAVRKRLWTIRTDPETTLPLLRNPKAFEIVDDTTAPDGTPPFTGGAVYNVVAVLRVPSPAGRFLNLIAPLRRPAARVI